ncbi:hypothetical protein VNO78_30740 [Psophocarpus tetragonolobus]|uniref:Uncharacterized protein n=1 Tax=Psophocarpus tetragonolobus TaxID=3891 RepID=A0AAN9X5I6_PSOTE
MHIDGLVGLLKILTVYNVRSSDILSQIFALFCSFSHFQFIDAWGSLRVGEVVWERNSGFMERNEAKMGEEEEMLNPNVVGDSIISVSQCGRCNELEERCKKAKVRCSELESELQKKKEHCEELEAKVMALEGERSEFEDKLKVLSEGLERKKEVSGGKRGEVKAIVDLTKDNEAVQLMIENKVLQYEKIRAESEVEVWQDKYQKLELLALQLGVGNGSYEEKSKTQESKPISNEGNLHLEKAVSDMQSADTPSDGILHRSHILDVLPGKKIIKSLTFQTDDSESNKMAPSTHIGVKFASVSVIDIIDSDDEPNVPQNPVPDRQGSESISVSKFLAEDEKDSNNGCAQNNQESLDLDENILFVATPKRKRTCNVVTSASENDDKDDDDDISLCKASNNNCAQNKQESLGLDENLLFTATPKRKRTCNVVTSESESDDDDIPISKLKRKHFQKLSSDQVRHDLSSSPPATISEDDKVTGTVVTRRRLLPLRKFVSKSQDDEISKCRPGKGKNQQSIPTNEDGDDDESEEDMSYNEGENMSDFIVDDSDLSNCEDTSSKSEDVSNCDVDSDSINSQHVQDSNMESDSQDVSDGEMDFGKILSQIQRSKTDMKWEFQADMLAAFGKDTELCMNAVCALYRQQTSEEQTIKGALVSNQRGFNKFDAYRGSILAEFLTDGDPYGGLKKSVKELEEYDPEAVEECRSLAIHYSKQLYEIYKNKEDPLFPG